MQYIHRKYIREAISMTLNSTYKLDLPETGRLAGMLLRISGSTVSGAFAAGGDWRIIDKISKVEVIGNGSTILKSLTGKLLQAIGWYDQKVTAPDVWRNYATNTQWCVIPILFGRQLWDPALHVNARDWSSLELQITNSATSSHFSDLTVSVLGYYLEPENLVPDPVGYLRTEEWRKWTTVQNATEYLDLPTEHLIRRVLLQLIPDVDANNVEETGLDNLADDIAFNLRTGAVEVYKGGIDDLRRALTYEFRAPIITAGGWYGNADAGFDMGVGYVRGQAGIAGTHDGAAAAVIPTIEGNRNSFTQKAESAEADTSIDLMVLGDAYHNTVPIFSAWGDDPNNYLDPVEEATVELNVHTRDAASAADGEIRVILDRLITR